MEPITAHTLTDPGRLRALLDEVRARGFSRLDQSFDEEVSSQGAPIFDAGGAVIGALSVAVPVVRATAEKCTPIRDALIRAADEITAALGGNARHRTTAYA